jgi:hypothetical protein
LWGGGLVNCVVVGDGGGDGYGVLVVGGVVVEVVIGVVMGLVMLEVLVLLVVGWGFFGVVGIAGSVFCFTID